MRNTLQLVTVGASAFAALASATSGHKPYNDPYTGTYMHAPPLERHQIARGDAVGGVEIAATSYGAVGWQLAIRNTTNHACPVVTHDNPSNGRERSSSNIQ